jgi:hypothetical protein
MNVWRITSRDYKWCLIEDGREEYRRCVAEGKRLWQVRDCVVVVLVFVLVLVLGLKIDPIFARLLALRVLPCSRGGGPGGGVR